MPNPTLEDVARQAGVSTATVSRCLNLPDKVSIETRKRVENAVRNLGYAPNFGAQALAAKRTNTFGAIVPTLDNAIFARGLQAFQEELGRHGITLLVASSSYRPELEDEQVRTLVARGADALLLIGHDRLPDTYRFLAQRDIPFAVSWAYDPSKPRASVGFDNRRSMAAMARQVIGFGHRRLALISAPWKTNDRARARIEGVRDAMRETGLDPRDLRIVDAPYSVESGRDALQVLMRSDPTPTAIICGNDVQAAGALAAARELGLRVPQDLSITGFDDMEIAGIVTPQLTTVRVPHTEMGRDAARYLIALRNGAAPEQPEPLEATITLRASLGPAPT